MSTFSRRKRPFRSYWVEIGFLILGVVGLKPSLITDMFLTNRIDSYASMNTAYPQYNMGNDPVRGWQSNDYSGRSFDWAAAYANLVNTLHAVQNANSPNTYVGYQTPLNSTQSLYANANMNPVNYGVGNGNYNQPYTHVANNNWSGNYASYAYPNGTYASNAGWQPASTNWSQSASGLAHSPTTNSNYTQTQFAPPTYNSGYGANSTWNNNTGWNTGTPGSTSYNSNSMVPSQSYPSSAYPTSTGTSLFQSQGPLWNTPVNPSAANHAYSMNNGSYPNNGFNNSSTYPYANRTYDTQANHTNVASLPNAATSNWNTANAGQYSTSTGSHAWPYTTTTQPAYNNAANYWNNNPNATNWNGSARSNIPYGNSPYGTSPVWSNTAPAVSTPSYPYSTLQR